ncbi:MAG: beta-galactosidase [Clostridiaceae bacterium]
MGGRKGIVWAYWGHEPMDHLRRTGNNKESIFNIGMCIEPWYKRIHGEEMIEKAYNAGINTVYTHFFKGFGLEHEKEEMENTCKLTQIAHKYDIKVLGYCQLGSLYYETAIDEIPDLEKMARIDQDGRIGTWGGAYYRWSPCFNSRAFIDYIKKVIEYGIRHVKLDGFHFDNSYNEACYCDNCRQKFIDFLEKNIANPREIFGLKSFKNVRIPPYKQLSEVHDPLYLWWLKYRSELCSNTHKELFSFVKDISDGKAEVLHNPAFPRKGRSVNEIGFEPSLSPDGCDFVFAENDRFIQEKEEALISQIEAFKFGQRFGYRVFDTSWPLNSRGGHRYPETYEEIMRFVCQSMIFGGICGTQWIARSVKKGDAAEIDIPGQLDILSNIFKYFKNNLELFEKNTKPYNHIKLLYHPFNCMASPGKGLKTFGGIIARLAAEGMPFSLVTGDDIPMVEENQVLIIPELIYIKEDLYKKIIEMARNGGKIIIIGEFAIYNENGSEYDSEKTLFELKKEGNVIVGSSEENAGNSEADWINILKRLTGKNSVVIEPGKMMIETSKDKNGRFLIHILNPDNDKLYDNIHVCITSEDIGTKYRDVKIYSPESTQLKYYKIDGSSMNIYLNGLKTMATIALETENERIV